MLACCGSGSINAGSLWVALQLESEPQPQIKALIFYIAAIFSLQDGGVKSKGTISWPTDGNYVMAQKESYIDRAEKLPQNLLSPEFATMGKQCVEAIVNVQTELLGNLQETNRHWLERVQSEAAIASKFATKLTATRSVSDAMTTCQEWTTSQIEMITEDSKLLVADTQRFIETGARLLWNGW